MIREYDNGAVRQRRIVRKILLVLIGVCLVLIFLKLGSQTGSLVVFPIKSVQIFGTSFVSKREVLEAIRLDANRSILTFNKGRARGALLGDQRVAGVEIVKLYPDSLRIYVVEKKAKALLRTGGREYWLSRDGIVLGVAEEGDPTDSTGAGSGPFITLVSNNDDIKVGGKAGNLLLQGALEAYAEMEESQPGFTALLKGFSVSRDGVRVQLQDERFQVYLGNTVSAGKLEQLRALLLVLNTLERAGKGRSGSFEIDMSFSQAAVRRKE